MAISLESRRVGDIAVIRCIGRITEGAASAALQRCLNDQLQFGPDIILDMGQVEFLDSSGLGLLVRFLTRTQSASGNLKLSAVSTQIREILRITRLDTLFAIYETEADAIADFYGRSASGPRSSPLANDILCVEQSPDALAYIRELLRHAGYGVLSATNLPDAITLLRATRPKIVVISAELRSTRSTATADAFNRLADSLAVVELPAGFSTDDPKAVGQQLLDRIRGVIGGGTAAAAG